MSRPEHGTDLLVDRSDFATVDMVDPIPADIELAAGQILVEVERFGLTANNVSYASAGDMLGYWNFFPAPDGWGKVPVWGFGTVTRSANPDLAEGEELFGYLPMGRRFIIGADSVSSLSLSDASPHRAGLHPWYNRYYRVANDPVSQSGHLDVQPMLWALFMTGWELAREFVDHDDHGADSVLVASASSRTAYSFGHSMKALGSPAWLVGLTSPANRAFVERLGVYDEVRTYDGLDLASIEGTAALVDMAGNHDVVAAAHQGFEDRLVQSIIIGGTHRGAGTPVAELSGPDRRFFFIPDVAEQRASVDGHAAYHQVFADAWAQFAPWAAAFSTVGSSVGADAIRDAWLALVGEGARATDATLLSY